MKAQPRAGPDGDKMTEETENHIVNVTIAYGWAFIAFGILAGVLIGWLGQP